MKISTLTSSFGKNGSIQLKREIHQQEKHYNISTARKYTDEASKEQPCIRKKKFPRKYYYCFATVYPLVFCLQCIFSFKIFKNSTFAYILHGPLLFSLLSTIEFECISHLTSKLSARSNRKQNLSFLQHHLL